MVNPGIIDTVKRNLEKIKRECEDNTPLTVALAAFEIGECNGVILHMQHRGDIDRETARECKKLIQQEFSDLTGVKILHC